MDAGAIENMVRVGKVSSVNSLKKTARVIFEKLGNLSSGDLPILQTGAMVSLAQASLTYGAETQTHGHTVTVNSWMPYVGQYVVCLYLPIFNGDGWIIGGLP